MRQLKSTFLLCLCYTGACAHAQALTLALYSEYARAGSAAEGRRLQAALAPGIFSTAGKGIVRG